MENKKFDPNAKVLIVDDICENHNNFTVEEEFNNVAIVLNEEDYNYGRYVRRQ